MYSADELRYDTYSLSVADVTSLVFSLQGCSEGHVALSEIPGNFETRTYEFVIGSNLNSECIFRLQPQGDVVAVRFHLHCTKNDCDSV